MQLPTGEANRLPFNRHVLFARQTFATWGRLRTQEKGCTFQCQPRLRFCERSKLSTLCPQPCKLSSIRKEEDRSKATTQARLLYRTIAMPYIQDGRRRCYARRLLRYSRYNRTTIIILHRNRDSHPTLRQTRARLRKANPTRRRQQSSCTYRIPYRRQRCPTSTTR